MIRLYYYSNYNINDFIHILTVERGVGARLSASGAEITIGYYQQHPGQVSLAQLAQEQHQQNCRQSQKICDTRRKRNHLWEKD